MILAYVYLNTYAQVLSKEVGKKLDNGLIKGHAYTITDVKEVEFLIHYLVCICNLFITRFQYEERKHSW